MALPLLTLPPGLDVLAVALGPVGRTPAPHPRVRLVTVRGTWDVFSSLGSRLRPDRRVPVGHLGYAANSGVRATVVRLAREFAQ